MIENEQDSVFVLKDALIKYNSKTDLRFRVEADPNQKRDSSYVYRNDIVVNKHLELSNVQFVYNVNSYSRYFEGVLLDIHFKKSILLEDVKSLYLQYCRFEEAFRYTLSNCDQKFSNKAGYDDLANFEYTDFSSSFSFYNNCSNSSLQNSQYFLENSFKPAKKESGFLFNVMGSRFFLFQGNTIANYGFIFYSVSNNSGRTRIDDNLFDSDFIHISKTNQAGNFKWIKNRYTSPVFLELDPFSAGDEVDWNQFEKGFAAYNPLVNYLLKTINRYPVQISEEERNNLVKQYLDSVRIYDEGAFTDEISIKSHFYSYFRSRYNTSIANKVYIDLKDFETQRLAILYKENKSFEGFFTWKINQFLKVFSAYGTKPAKAVVFSMWVILLFALIYLFFPNSWDKHGKNRIIDRFSFFFKYMNKNAGIHEVYLEEQKEELMSYDTFKNLITNSKETVPKFFSFTALPMYKWAISGTKLSAAILKRMDIMKGTWSELPQKKRFWKSILLTGAFTIAILFDIFIKMLNALMLSINTFTTLGFGEIPIKGLPRYLAIVEGFIGWFMLTIFSVSLISQLLN